MSFAVAIDGPAAAGKGTIARVIADHFGLEYLDTGLLYRFVGRARLEGAQDLAEIARTIEPGDLKHVDLRAPAVSQAASEVAKMPEVRSALMALQRRFAKIPKGAVLDGRDIGTVICPEADVKLYVFANREVRAKRRHLELTANGLDIPFEKVLSDLQVRDCLDMERSEAPLRPADDALKLDTSELTVDDANQRAIALVTAQLNKGGNLSH